MNPIHSQPDHKNENSVQESQQCIHTRCDITTNNIGRNRYIRWAKKLHNYDFQASCSENYDNSSLEPRSLSDASPCNNRIIKLTNRTRPYHLTCRQSVGGPHDNIVAARRSDSFQSGICNRILGWRADGCKGCWSWLNNSRTVRDKPYVSMGS